MSQLLQATAIPFFEQSQSPPLTVNLRQFFAPRGISAYLVGGSIRDPLLGVPTADADVAAVCDVRSVGPELANFLEGRLIPLDAERGILRIAFSEHGVPSFLDLTEIHGDINDDLGRRDFTIDAMAVLLGAPAEDSPIDPFGGMADLQAGVIRAVSRSVFRDDPARLMRAPRLAAQLGFRIDEATSDRIRDDAHLVTGVSGERVREELLKLLAAPGAVRSIRCLDDLGLLDRIIPELSAAKGVTQPNEHYWDVYDHSVETVGQVERLLQATVEPSDFVTALMPRFDSMDEYFKEKISDGHTRLALVKLTGLLHDIAKPMTRTVEESGRIRFLGHHREGAAIVRTIMQRLRISGRGIDLVGGMVDAHLRPAQMAQRGELPTDRALYRYYRDVGDAAVDTLYLNMADYLAARGPMLERREWAGYCELIGHILRADRRRPVPSRAASLVDGHDLMEEFSLDPGPELGAPSGAGFGGTGCGRDRHPR